MPIEEPTVLKINAVLVGPKLQLTSDEIRSIAEKFRTEAIESPLQRRVTPLYEVPQRIELPRERILIYGLRDRVVFEQAYPLNAEAHGFLSEVSNFVMATSEANGTSITEIGYNMELTYNQTTGYPTFTYIGKQLFGDISLEVANWQFAGGFGTLMFEADEEKWTVQIEPRTRDKEIASVFLRINLSPDANQLPDVDEMKNKFALIQCRANEFARKLDGNQMP